MSEVLSKIALVQEALERDSLAGVRFRGVDFFSWITGGGSNVVILTSEVGIAEILITAKGAWLLTDKAEVARLVREEVSDFFSPVAFEWFDTDQRNNFVAEMAENGKVASDRPKKDEEKLPQSILDAKKVLLPLEIERYKKLGRSASECMTEVLSQADPDWTELQLAAAGARALWSKGIHPTLILVGGEERMARYRHPFPTQKKIGQQAMMVFCARQFGLYANLSRFISFKSLSDSNRRLHDDVALVESAALDNSILGRSLRSVLECIKNRYETLGYPDEFLKFHQGGTTGYLSREVVVGPHCSETLRSQVAVAWNPTITGVKIEDTFLVNDSGLENLTHDSDWPHKEVAGRLRPVPWERT